MPRILTENEAEIAGGAGRPWLDALPLLLCGITFAVAPGLVFALPLLAIPLTAWLASRHGTAALLPASVMLAPMLVRFDAGPFGLAGSVGLYLAALMVGRIVADARLRRAILGAAKLPPRLGMFVLLGAMPWFVASPVVSGARISIDLWCLVMVVLLAIGASRTPLRPLTTAVLCAWAGGVALRLLGFPIAGPYGVVGFGLSSPSDLAIAMIALHGPRALRQGVTQGRILALLATAAVLARLRFQPAFDALAGPIAPFTFASDALAALLAAGAGAATPARWWTAPVVFGLVRLPLALALPGGLQLGTTWFSGGGLLAAMCQTFVMAAFARLGAAATREPALAAQDSDMTPLRAAAISEGRRALALWLLASGLALGLLLAMDA